MNYEFKVGDKGPLRNDLGTYEILAIDHELDRPIVAKIRRDHNMKPYATTRLLNGREISSEGAFDLMPPEEYVWVNWYRSTNGDAWCVVHYRKEVAARVYDTFVGSSTGIKRAVKTKVPKP